MAETSGNPTENEQAPGKNNIKNNIIDIASKMPWPKSVDQKITDNVETFLKEGESLTLSISQQIEIEGYKLGELSALLLKPNEYDEKKLFKEQEELFLTAAEMITGYQEVFWELAHVQRLEESNGDIEQHPEHERLEKIGQTSSGTHALRGNDPIEEAEELLRNKRMFDLIRSDPSGISVLNFVLESKKESLIKRGLDPSKNPSAIGLEHGVRRYQELYEHFSKQ